MFDRKIFEYLKTMDEWKELGESFKEIFSEMPREDVESMTQEDMDKIVCEEVWDQAIALTSKLVYEKLQADLDIRYGNGPVADLKETLTKRVH